MGGWRDRIIPRDAREGECGWCVSYQGQACGNLIPKGIKDPYCSRHMKVFILLTNTCIGCAGKISKESPVPCKGTKCNMMKEKNE